ncbi:MAG: general secretion pathway protein GspK [Proteobacteria bacterium]|nr:general secretion pathway protein GspK [Pseudomonadota bacterium]MBU1708999.1 general secretion pathway protein GspK [Pseudomonadota bacterium]
MKASILGLKNIYAQNKLILTVWRSNAAMNGNGECLSKNDGFALLVVIVVLLLTTFLASQLIMQVRTETKITFNAKKRTTERFLAQGGINLAIFRLIDDPLNTDDEEYDKDLLGYTYEETSLSTGKILYYVVNEAGKIDLNSAPPRLLELFLEYHGLEENQIATVLDSLLDWRDADDFHRLNGAEQDYYQGLEDPYVPRNGNLEDPGEVFMVNGMEILRGKFDPEAVFTVHNFRGKYKGKINFNSLTPAMLDFIVEGDQEKKDTYFEMQKEFGTLSAQMAQTIIGNDRYAVISPYLSTISPHTQESIYYNIVATGFADPGQEKAEDADYGPGTRVSVIIEKQSGDRIKYLSWKESRS